VFVLAFAGEDFIPDDDGTEFHVLTCSVYFISFTRANTTPQKPASAFTPSG
jgi:hypothetical protein